MLAVWKVALFYRLLLYFASPLKSMSVKNVSPSDLSVVAARFEALPLDGGFLIFLGVYPRFSPVFDYLSDYRSDYRSD